MKGNVNLFLAHGLYVELKHGLNNLISSIPFFSSNQKTEPKPPILDHKTRYSNIIREDNADRIQAFIQTGADVDKFGPNDNTTPLIVAAANGHLNSVRGLIAAGANLMLTDTLHDRNALEWAFMYSHSKVSACLLDNMSPEQIQNQVKNRPSRLPGLNAFIETHQLKKLQQQLFAIMPKNQENSPFTRLPTELLFHIFSQNHPTLTAEKILQKINLAFNAVDNIKEKEVTKLEVKNQVLLENAPEPVVFSAIETVENTPALEQTNNLEIDLERKNKNKNKLK